MRPPTPIVALSFLLVALAGCVDGDTASAEGPKEPNPKFVASLVDPPTETYDSIVTAIGAEITNVQHIKPGQRVGEGGAHQVCVELDGEILNNSDGAPVCELVGLANQETKLTWFRLPPLEAGTYNVSIIDASVTLVVKETPRIGQQIEGTLANIMLVDVREYDTGWEWDLKVEWVNDEARQLMQEAYEEDPDATSGARPISMNTQFGSDPNSRRPDMQFDGGIEALKGNSIKDHLFDPQDGDPIRIILFPSQEYSHLRVSPTDPRSGQNVFVWCCV